MTLRFQPSPVRGTCRTSGIHHHILRFIPTRAGNVSCHRCSTAIGAVHPRPCGERAARFYYLQKMAGSSPPVRGTCVICVYVLHVMRFIPARAGNVGSRGRWPGQTPVHPRPCGERATAAGKAGRHTGSSPPVRGTLERDSFI